MLQTLKARKIAREESGFTLIELMVVILIIAVLLAIAIPSFLGARTSSQNRAAQSSARNALTAAKVIQSNTGTYAAANTVASLTAVEPSLTYVSGTASTGPNNVSIQATTTLFAAAVRADTGTCWRLLDNANGGTTYGSDTAACTAATGTAPTGGW